MLIQDKKINSNESVKVFNKHYINIIEKHYCLNTIQLLQQLNPRKAIGHDKIPPVLIKIAANF